MSIATFLPSIDATCLSTATSAADASAIGGLLDVLATTSCGSQPSSVLDVGCGDGSLSDAVVLRFPHAQVTSLVPAGDELPDGSWAEGRLEFRHANLDRLDWLPELTAVGFDVVISAGGLSWLGPQQLVGFYCALPQILHAQAVVVGADRPIPGQRDSGVFHLGHDFHMQALRAAGFVATTLPAKGYSDGVMLGVYP